MKIIHLKNDGSVGNCLFQSCGYHLKINHHRLRQRVADMIQSNMNLTIQGLSLRDWIKNAGHNPFTYPNLIRQDGVFGTGIELCVISIMYRRSIIVMRRSPKLTQIAEYFPEFGNPIILLFSGPATGGHYQPLVKGD